MSFGSFCSSATVFTAARAANGGKWRSTVSERKGLIDQILTFPANTYTREFLDGPHPQTGQPYSIAELETYLADLRQTAAKSVRNQTVMTSAEELLYRQETVSFEFLTRHTNDFNNCAANIGLIKDWFQEHRLDWSSENLERAFSELKTQLAPVPGAVTTQPLAQEPPPPPTPVAPVVQPAEPSPGLSMAEITKWDAATLRKKMADPVTRKRIDAVLAAEAELQRLARQQDARQRQMENQ
jgi:hypothetical protein